MEAPLWSHQQQALDVSVQNHFLSGTHAHATGSGKSILGHALIRAFAKQHPRCLMMWLCEQTSVIADIFSRKGSRQGLLVCDLVSNKPKDWWSSVQSALIWKIPVLIIINRAFLVSQGRYTKLRQSKLGLILHDECHSGVGDTTKRFYSWLNDTHPQAHVIGLSATPPTQQDAPHPSLSNILTRYSIFDATKAGTIVPLRICWCNSKEYRTPEQDARISLHIAEHHGVVKIIVWCGTIQHCYESATLWSRVFHKHAKNTWKVCADTSLKNTMFGTYADFANATSYSMLFCAAKHREGSDIAGLGMGVFVDGVEKRGSAVFVQCAGRVLRKSKSPFPIKKYGILLDLQAKDGMTLCDRVGDFLQLPQGHVPWTFDHHMYQHTHIQSLELAPHDIHQTQCEVYSKKRDDLVLRFVRDVPHGACYAKRLDDELQLIEEKELVPHLLRAMDVLALAGSDVPHVTRGSCGSSLVCYLLGISHVDPVKHNICFARFLNTFRKSLPDIDFDFPHNQRGSIFLRMALKWSGKIARISNHVHYHEKSALRAALRSHGHKSNIPTCELQRFMQALPKLEKQMIEEDAKQLEGEFHCYSLHCGGVVYYPDGVPPDAILGGKAGRLMAQVQYDKRDVSGDGLFKIDVLSSRALAQLYDAMDVSSAHDVKLDQPQFTTAVRTLFAKGHNIGITLAESPLCRSELTTIQPTCVEDVAKCLALIRPAARESEGVIVYDDDAIHIIAREVGCTEAKADDYRRGLAKKDRNTINELQEKMGKERMVHLQKKLGSLSQYGFCKAHAMSYAQLVSWLAWCKVEKPKAFWKATLNHCHSSYKPWVHLWEAWKVGVDPYDETLLRNNVSIYAKTRKKKQQSQSILQQLKSSWTWDVRKGFVPNCFCHKKGKNTVEFRGVIACHRRLSKTSVAFCVGCGDQYLDFICHGCMFHVNHRVINGFIEDGIGKHIVLS